MKIIGIQPLTLLDYPGKVACIVFTAGCNLNCGYCHNYEQVNRPHHMMNFDRLLSFLKDKVGKLDGVVISGGEALLNYGEEFISELQQIKDLGFSIKLDTNGAFPNALMDLIERKLIDYVAMDIKGSFHDYPEITGITDSLKRFDLPRSINESINLLMESNIDYEFRTTVIHPIHNYFTFMEIGERIKGAKRYFLQRFEMNDCVRNHNLISPSKDHMIQYSNIMKKYVDDVQIRGI